MLRAERNGIWGRRSAECSHLDTRSADRTVGPGAGGGRVGAAPWQRLVEPWPALCVRPAPASPGWHRCPGELRPKELLIPWNPPSGNSTAGCESLAGRELQPPAFQRPH